jgi:hypothetical protein
MPLSESDFDNISAIWMLSSYDIDPIVTYKGIADRLGIDEKDARRLVESRPELFSPVIAKKWLEHWKKWVTEGLHYPGWVLKEKETKKDRDELVGDLEIRDVFRSQARTRGDPDWEWKDSRTPPPGSGPSAHEQVKLGLEHLDRLRKAAGEAADRQRKDASDAAAQESTLKQLKLTRYSVYVALATATITVLATSLTNFVTWENTLKNAEIASRDATTRRLDVYRQILGDAYASSLDAMQSAFDASRVSDGGEVQKQLGRIHMNLLRLEPLIDKSEFRNQLWGDYEELRVLLSEILRAGQQSPPPQPDTLQKRFEALRDKMHDRLYDLTRAGNLVRVRETSAGSN